MIPFCFMLIKKKEKQHYATFLESKHGKNTERNRTETWPFSLTHILSHSVGISFRACLQAVAWSTHTEDLQYFLPGTKN